MDRTKNFRWGEWIKDRAAIVGFHRQSDFAAVVGCGRAQMSNWFCLALPPRNMRKGFDVALARALRVDHAMLFSSFSQIAPCDAPLIDSTDEDHGQPDAIRRRVLAMVELMPNDGLKELARVGEVLLRSGNVLQIA